MTEPVEYVELPQSAADRERFRQIAQQSAAHLEAKRDGLHVITERADGPDLHDLVRLIEYLRAHDLDPVLGGTLAMPCHLTVRWHSTNIWGRESHWGFTENELPHKARFVGPDGTVYDANREAL